MYHPTAEQAESDRKKAYETGVPHGYVAAGDKYKGLPTIDLLVISELVRLLTPSFIIIIMIFSLQCVRTLQHTADEYGEKVNKQGGHSGGPFIIKISPTMRVEEVRKVIRVSLVHLLLCFFLN